MAYFPSSYQEGNRVYWKIPESLPIAQEKVKKYFQLHNKSWQYQAYYYKSYGYLSVDITPYNPCVCHLPPCVSPSFEVRGGIIGDSQKEIISRDSLKTRKSEFILHEMGHQSEIDLYIKSNQVLYIFIEMIEVKSIKPDKLGNRRIDDDYRDLFLSGIDSDLTIEVKDKKFQCHRCILRVRSPVFFAMLGHDTKEKASGVVKVLDAEPRVFQEFLFYLYTGNICYHMNWESVTDLYKLGDKYILENLKSSCVKQMKENISKENFSEFFLLSQQCNELELAETTVQFFLENSKEIIDNEDWLTFVSQNPVESNALIEALAAREKKKMIHKLL